MPDTDELYEAVAQQSIEPATASVDGQSVSNADPEKTLRIADRFAAKTAAQQRRSGWRGVITSRFRTQGGGVS